MCRHPLLVTVEAQLQSLVELRQPQRAANACLEGAEAQGLWVLNSLWPLLQTWGRGGARYPQSPSAPPGEHCSVTLSLHSAWLPMASLPYFLAAGICQWRVSHGHMGPSMWDTLRLPKDLGPSVGGQLSSHIRPG